MYAALSVLSLGPLQALQVHSSLSRLGLATLECPRKKDYGAANSADQHPCSDLV